MTDRRLVVVAYDVSTDTAEGRRRLRRAAQVCCGYGVRVQKSVFECRVTPAQLARLLLHLSKTIHPAEDSLRVYSVRAEPTSVITLGMERHLDLDGLLLV